MPLTYSIFSIDLFMQIMKADADFISTLRPLKLQSIMQFLSLVCLLAFSAHGKLIISFIKYKHVTLWRNILIEDRLE